MRIHQNNFLVNLHIKCVMTGIVWCTSYFVQYMIYIKIWYDDGSIITLRLMWVPTVYKNKYTIIKYLYGLNFFFFFMKIGHKARVSFSCGFLLQSLITLWFIMNDDLLTCSFFTKLQLLHRPDVYSIMHNNNISIVINKQKLTFLRRL